jgi:integrase
MSGPDHTQRRVRVERNIYRRPTGVLEVGFKDGAGIQRWRTVDGGIMAARALRDDLLARRGRGEVVSRDARPRFGGAADERLNGPVLDLRASTQAGYRNAVEQHLRARFGGRKLDDVTADDLAAMVRDLRGAGKSEATSLVVLGVTGRIYKLAARRLGWHEPDDPDALIRAAEGFSGQAPIFTGEQIEQTITVAPEPIRTMFTVAALTGARMSELCGLTWADVTLADLDKAELTFAWQIDRTGDRRPTKTHGSARTVPIPRELAVLLARHKLAARDMGPEAFVFATRTRHPFGQRNVQRALRRAHSDARDGDGRPTFPILHELDVCGDPVKVPQGALPSMHSFRHTVASRALLAGESVDEVAFLRGTATRLSPAPSRSTRARIPEERDPAPVRPLSLQLAKGCGRRRVRTARRVRRNPNRIASDRV